MEINDLKRFRTPKDIQAYFAKEHGNAQVSDSSLGKTQYLNSSTMNGLIRRNWFLFWGDSGKVGVAYSDVLKTELTVLVDADFLHCIYFHDNLWLCVQDDNTVRVLLNGKFIEKTFDSYDVLQMTDRIVFLQLDASDGRSLICSDTFNQRETGIFIPENEDDFTSFYEALILRYGREGFLDNLNVSDLWRIYSEVCMNFWHQVKYCYLGEKTAES